MSDPGLRVLLIDHEPADHSRMAALLERRDEAHLVGVAERREDAVDKIHSLTPHIVFLGLELDEGTGLDVIDTVGLEVMPTTVFVSAHDEYAIEAFRFEPADYLLKPFTDERFIEALCRAGRRVRVREVFELRGHLLALLQDDGLSGNHGASDNGGSYLRSLAIPRRGRVEIVPVADIDCISASGVYSEVHAGDAQYILRTSLSALEEQLNPREFYRIHRSTIVRIERITALLRESGGEYRAQLISGRTLPVGRTRRAGLEALLGRL
ncbi:MAG: LytTR family DNA-binding domain-containing protein [Gemmatimonadota bacterium]